VPRWCIMRARMETNVIYCGDNLEVMPKYIDDGSVDLIYIDPPFNTSRQYEVFWGEAQERRAFEDRFGDAMTYLDWMRPRIRELHRALKRTGSFYYHCDWHASHYVKIELDRVFGFNSFRNEVVWERTTGRKGGRQFGRAHDVILFYTKSDKSTWNRQVVRQTQETVRGHDLFADSDGSVWRLSDLSGAGQGPPRTFGDRVIPPPHGRHWQYDQEGIDELLEAGRIAFSRGGQPRLKTRLDELPGVAIRDVWTDIRPVNSAAVERLGYPTQKPLALLERIIKASSNEGDVVFDAFCGCGTTLEAAAKFKRRWIGIDMSPTACRVMAQRLDKRLGLREGIDFKLIDMPKTEDDLRRIPHREFENWAVIALGGIPNEVKVGDYGIDGRLYLADIEKERKGDFFETLDNWYPIQVKQQDRAGRPDLDKFETAMRRDKRLRGYFIAFGFSTDAIREIKRANREDSLDIVPITVKELLEHERVAT
jgi:DNA modification methylase